MRKSQVTDLLSKAKAAREFWIDSIPNDEDLSDDESYVYDAFEKKPIQGPPQWIHNLVHVREVTASDEAITRLIEQHLEALEIIEILKTAAGEYSFDGVPKEVWDQYHEFMRKIGET